MYISINLTIVRVILYTKLGNWGCGSAKGI